jgi:hypothetical protein
MYTTVISNVTAKFASDYFVSGLITNNLKKLESDQIFNAIKGLTLEDFINRYNKERGSKPE